MSQGKGLETHQGQRQLHTGSDYCIWKARKKESGNIPERRTGQEVEQLIEHQQECRSQDFSISWGSSPESAQRLMANTDIFISLLPKEKRLGGTTAYPPSSSYRTRMYFFKTKLRRRFKKKKKKLLQVPGPLILETQTPSECPQLTLNTSIPTNQNICGENNHCIFHSRHN